MTTTAAGATRPRVTRIATTMADGRELIYFDETPDAERVLADPRDLPAVIPGSQVRYDALLGEWVGIAGHRQTRTYHPPANACPLCPSTPGNQSEIPSADYDVVVFENRFPSFAGTGETADATVGCSTPGRATGAARWCVSPPTTTRLLSALPTSRVRTVIEAWADRTAALSAHARCRAGVLLREPRRGDRGDPGPPARADLRLPVRHPEDRRGDPLRPGVPGRDRPQPVRRRARRRDRRRLADRRAERALGGVRAVRRPLAGRGASVPAAAGPGPDRSSTTPNATHWPSCTWR